MKFSIVTPSFRNSQWLKLCIASVADQQGVELEHIVQDAGSDDGTLDWLPHDRRVRAFVENDNGMYDAVNRGWRRATGEILAYINCDEQYLPGALQAVAEFFRVHPEVDVVFADTVVVDKDGRFICYRKSLVPWPHVVWICFPILTCSTFIHRRVLDKHGVFFDTRWRDLGDFFWVHEMMQRGLKMRLLRHFTSVFTDTGVNMNLGPNAQRERQLKNEMTPRWIWRLRWPLVQLHRARQVLRGLYFQKPFSYAIYTMQSPDKRVEFHVQKPTGIWWSRH